MIDYDKLKIAHELILKHGKITLQYSFCGALPVPSYVIGNETFSLHFLELDELIAKLRELTYPALLITAHDLPKNAKIGDSFLVSNVDGKIKIQELKND